MDDLRHQTAPRAGQASDEMPVVFVGRRFPVGISDSLYPAFPSRDFRRVVGENSLPLSLQIVLIGQWSPEGEQFTRRVIFSDS